MIVVSYGGGTNSTAMLVGMHFRGERPDLIVFSDTGAEKPHTYQHLDLVDEWLCKNDFPTITRIQGDAANHSGGLEKDCLRRKSLPSIAYGFKTCSQRFKIEPFVKLMNSLPAARSVWEQGGKVQRIVGYDASEPHRADRKIPADVAKKYDLRYPLIEWNWGREECVAAIARAGLPQPGKSACFFCPSSKKHEILDLRNRYPDLLQRALAIEANAETTTVKGLGRHFRWADLVAFDDAQLCMFSDAGTPEIDCGCYDGEPA